MSAGTSVVKQLIETFVGSFKELPKAGDAASDLIQQATRNVDFNAVHAGSDVGRLRKTAQSLVGLNKGNDEIVTRRFAGDVSKRVYGAVQSRNVLEETLRGTDAFKTVSEKGTVDIDESISSLISGNTPEYLKDIKSDALDQAVAIHAQGLRSLGVDISKAEDVMNIDRTLGQIGLDNDIMGMLGRNIKDAGIRGQAGAMFGARFIKNGKATPVRGVLGMVAPTVGITFGANLLSVPNKVLDVATEDAIRRGRI